MKKPHKNSPNSFYSLGGIEILSLAQDETSGLWKIYLSTTDHYLVSREFDRSVGMYANAPDGIIRQGLMDFSDSLIGNQLSLFKIMDMFIDRCFDDGVFGKDVENAIWMSIDYPSYEEMEEMLNVYNCRIKWFPKDDSSNSIAEITDRILYRTPTGSSKDEVTSELKNEMDSSGITSIFMNSDAMVEKFLMDETFSDIPVFIGDFFENGEFSGFSYMKR